jgi:hypothetical protein
MDANLTIPHIHEYIRLWVELCDVHLREEIEDSIVWNLTSNGEYSTASAYNTHFFGTTSTNMNKLVWKAWAPPKIKFFAWLAIQNRLWMADRLEERGWTNCSLCPLCKQCQETVVHLLSQCRFTKRLWGMMRDWLGLPHLQIGEWAADIAIDEWWMMMARNSKAMASMTMLVCWTIWKERNARVFNNKSAPPPILFEIIKSEARLWVRAGAKMLSFVILGV